VVPLPRRGFPPGTSANQRSEDPETGTTCGDAERPSAFVKL
jgi:hypothetical protein